jgi:hypothetical protein
VKKNPCAALGALTFIVIALFAAGCGRQTVGEMPGDHYNSAMSDKQKTIIEAHKNQPTN